MNTFKIIAFMLLINCAVLAQVKSTKPKGRPAMYLAFDIATKERFVFPIQFFKLNKVKKILASNIKDPDNDFILEFNHKGQWIGLGTKGENLLVKYKNDMPADFTNNYGRMLDFYYSGDTAVVKIENRIWQYILVGNMFLDTKSYPYEKDMPSLIRESGTGINSKTIRKTGKDREVVSEPVDLKETDFLPRLIKTYSNTNWILPLSIDYDDHAYKGRTDMGNVERARYFYDKAGNLIVNISENGLTTNRVFKMKNGLPMSMTTRWIGRQMKGTPEAKPEITRFSYTYFQ